jgi:hypothetical protein
MRTAASLLRKNRIDEPDEHHVIVFFGIVALDLPFQELGRFERNPRRLATGKY